MDNRKAEQELRTLRDSITQVLGDKGSQTDSSDIKESIGQAQESAREGAKALKKSLIERIKDLPVVTQVSQLGAAGTVAVSTAAVTQVDIAKDRTEVFVAEVAQDVIEERFEVPMFIDNFVDFATLNDWGQEVISEKIAEAQNFVQEASSQPQTSTQSAPSQDSTPEPAASSNSSSSEKSAQSDQPQQTDKSSESQKTEQEVKGENSSKEGDSEESEQAKQQQDQEQKAESTKESQETSSDDQSETREVNDKLPIIETPIDNLDDDIKPHSNVRSVSPTS
jgi:DNA polymerase III gamma/tau subunit